MDDEVKDEIFSTIQTFLKMPPLVVWGSGATVSLGLPTMWKLNELLKEKIVGFDSEGMNNLEAELGKDKYITNLPAIKKVIWDAIKSADINALKEIVSNKNDDIDGIKKLLNKFYSVHPQKIDIITTNYDRILENVLSYNNLPFSDGFNGKELSIFNEKLFKKDKNVNLIKVHGSLNWFNVGGDIRYLTEHNEDFEPYIISPGNKKYKQTYSKPYRELIQIADDYIKTSSSFLVVGFGFNDEHLTPQIIHQVKQGVPIVIISKKITESCKKELVEAQKFIFLEENGENETRVFYRLNVNSEINEVIIKDDYWQLKKFMEII